MRLAYLAWFFALLLVAAVLLGCGSTSAPAAISAPVNYADPFAYCAAAGTVDAPGSNYVGPQVPESVAQGLQKALNAPDTPIEVLQNGSFWRCPADDFAPAWSPDGSRIAFASDRDNSPGVYDLYLMNADGSGVTRLTADAGSTYAPTWSPDGTRIAFRSDRDGSSDIYVIRTDGTGLQDLTKDPGIDWALSWSPDGSRIAFQTNRDGNWEIYAMNADGTAPTNLTHNPADDQLPFWGR